MILQELWREEMDRSAGRKEDGVARQTGGTGVQSGEEVWREGESRLWVFPTSLGHSTVKAARKNKEEIWKFN